MRVKPKLCAQCFDLAFYLLAGCVPVDSGLVAIFRVRVALDPLPFPRFVAAFALSPPVGVHLEDIVFEIRPVAVLAAENPVCGSITVDLVDECSKFTKVATYAIL